MSSALEQSITRADEAVSEAALRREVLRLAWPVVLQSSFRTIFFVVDTAMLGHYSKTALAAVGIAGPLMFTFLTLLSALSVGTVAIVSRAVGERNMEKAQRDGGTALLLALGAGTFAMAVCLLFVPHMVSLFSVDPKTVGLAAESYLRVLAWVFPFITVELVIASILRAAGNTWAAMVAAASANLLNIGLNRVFIYGLRVGTVEFPELGVKGAALATATAYVVEAVLVAAFLFSKRSPLLFPVRSTFNFHWESLKKLVRVSVPATVEPVVVQSGFLVMTWMVTKLGDTVLAAHRATMAIESLSFMPGFGFSLACAALVGQRLGAGQPEEAARSMRETARLSLAVMSVLALIFLVFARPLIRISTSDAQIVELGAVALMIGALEQPTMSLSFVLQGLLRGAGDTKSPLLVAVIGVWLVRVPLAYYLAISQGMGLNGIWLTTVVDWAVRAAVLWVIYRRGAWKRITL